jgi:cytochrome c-type biogenesis protein CcmF
VDADSPAVLFIGFASLVVPWAWAIYGLAYRDWDGWVKGAFPWTLFAFAALGFGVALGGYWAYETLGWGGFWGWDPVENASLVPWLFLTGLLHGLAIQRGNGGYKVTNFLLGVLPFAFMFYGTFLTRTGLLEGFSNHTFSSLGKDGFSLLLGAVIATVLIPLALLAWRFKSIPKPVAYQRVVTREFGFFMASALLGIIGLITAVGMSAPLLTKLWLEKGAAAQPSFYNQASYPLAILLAAGMAATPYFAWRATNTDGVLKRLFPAYAASIVLTFGLLLMGARDPWMLLLFAAGTFAVLTNAVMLAPRLKRRESRRTVGGFVAHAGAGLALMGVACLVAFSRNERVMLVKDTPRDAMGYRLTYLGMASQPFDRANTLRIKVERDGKSWERTRTCSSRRWAARTNCSPTRRPSIAIYGATCTSPTSAAPPPATKATPTARGRPRSAATT